MGLPLNQGVYILGQKTRSQSADRCVMRQKAGASVFLERIRKERDFCSFVFVRFLSPFYDNFQEILNLKFRSNVSFTSESYFVLIGLFFFKMLPHVIVFQVCRAYYCLFVYGDTHRNRS